MAVRLSKENDDVVATFLSGVDNLNLLVQRALLSDPLRGRLAGARPGAARCCGAARKNLAFHTQFRARGGGTHAHVSQLLKSSCQVARVGVAMARGAAPTTSLEMDAERWTVLARGHGVP